MRRRGSHPGIAFEGWGMMNPVVRALTDAPSTPGVEEGLARLRAGTLSAAAWAGTCRNRIAARDGDVMAWAHLADDDAMPAAADAGADLPLFGLPFGVKDVIDVAGMPTGCNSPTMAGFIAASDAAAVARLRAAGAVPIGKTVTTEFAFIRPGPTRNPLDPTRTPGGSSSGSAAAVADGQAPVALATQTGGSAIRPAAYCGIVGYKPPLGTVPLAGLRILDPNMDTIGIHARSVADVAAVATVMEGRPRQAGGRTAVTLVTMGLGEGPGAEAINAAFLEACAASLRASGASVVEAGLPFDRARLDVCHRTLMSAAVARGFDTLYREQRESLSNELVQFIERGRRHTAVELADARAHVERVREAIDGICGRDAVLLWPAATGEAPVGLHTTGDSSLNRPWSLLGYGVMTVPAAVGPAGMPLGLQIIDPQPGAPLLFEAAAAAESVLATRNDNQKTMGATSR